jgi:nucleoside-diphosphate-sugar epimerase
MRVLIIGGTGFIGYHAIHELLRRGHEVTALGLPPGPAAGVFPETVSVELGHVDHMAAGDLDTLLTGYDSVVFAAGADDRTVPESPAARFFYEANVRSAVRLAAAALRAGVKRFVLLGSYFTHFDREWPQMKLAEHHPYIESRKQQQELCTAIAGSDMALVALELPYIFGSMPGIVPLWTPLVSYIRSGVPLFYTRGGSNMVSVTSVAEAIAGACEHINESRVFQVGDQNLEWTELLQKLCAVIDRADDAVHILPEAGLDKLSWLVDIMHTMGGKEGGLHAAHFAHIQTSHAFFDIQESKHALGYQVGGLDDALRDTVAACPEGPALSYWRRLSDKAQQLIGRN